MNKEERKLVNDIEKLYKSRRNEINNRMYGLGAGEEMIDKLGKLFKKSKANKPKSKKK